MRASDTAAEPLTSTGSAPLGRTDPGADLIGRAGFDETEHLLSGTAADEPFATRMLVRAPIDPERFSGVVIVEPMHWSGERTVWRSSHRHILSAGHAWVEVASQSSAPRHLKRFDAARYERVSIIDGAPGGPAEASIGTDAAAGRSFDDVRRESDAFRARWERSSFQSPEILAAAAATLRRGETGLHGVTAVLLSGLSQSGGVARTFAIQHHARLSGDEPVFDGYLPMSSGGDAVPDLSVPVLELLGESEQEELRAPFLLPGQVRGLSHRRPDSDSFRLWEVPGMGHIDSRDSPFHAPQGLLAPGERPSRFPNAHVIHAAWSALTSWAVDGRAAPAGRQLELDPEGRIARDEHGHGRGGVRTAYLDVPESRVRAIAGPGPEWAQGVERPFTAREMRELYATPRTYRRRAASRVTELVDAGYCLPSDADDYLARISWAN